MKPIRSLNRALGAALAPLALAAALPGCGTFTNVPAMINVQDLKPAVLTYQFTNGTAGAREIKIDQPTVTLVGQPGSIGVTYDRMIVTYLDAQTEAPADRNKLPPLSLRSTFRVASSALPGTTGASGLIDQTKVGQQVFASSTTITLPVVNSYVEQYGLSLFTPGVTAQVQLQGSDDAGFPADLAFYVPISFVGNLPNQ